MKVRAAKLLLLALALLFCAEAWTQTKKDLEGPKDSLAFRSEPLMAEKA